jgi:hypothetical protein
MAEPRDRDARDEDLKRMVGRISLDLNVFAVPAHVALMDLWGECRSARDRADVAESHLAELQATYDACWTENKDLEATKFERAIIRETLEFANKVLLLSDPDVQAQHEQGLIDIREGRGMSLAELKARVAAKEGRTDG